jgi:ATP-dependent protease ClpP protease subunit
MVKRIEIEGVIGWHDQATPEYLAAELRAANGDAVELHFNSPGGLVGAGLKMYNLIRDYPGETTAVLAGYAMSMASYIPQACGKVMAKDNAVYMIHNARGWTGGDHNEVLKYGNYLKGLSGISAREFVKQTAKRGKAKSLADITAMMDAETFLFGEEMVTEGFVDGILDTGDDSDKETALATAQATFNEAMAMLTANPDRVKADLQLAMQIYGDARPFGEGAPTQSFSTPAAPAAGNSTEEGKQMKLAELLAANPEARAEYDQAITAAEGKGKEEMQTTVTAVSKYLNNKDYPAQVGTMALQVLSGAQPKANLDAIVATADMMKEMQAGGQAAAASATLPDTPGQGGNAAPVANATDVSSEMDLGAAIAQFKSEGGN